MGQSLFRGNKIDDIIKVLALAKYGNGQKDVQKDKCLFHSGRKIACTKVGTICGQALFILSVEWCIERTGLPVGCNIPCGAYSPNYRRPQRPFAPCRY